MADQTKLDEGFEAQARAMKDFGYHDVTADMIRGHHAAWIKGEGLPGVIFMFSVGAFEKYPEIFGERPE